MLKPVDGYLACTISYNMRSSISKLFFSSQAVNGMKVVKGNTLGFHQGRVI